MNNSRIKIIISIIIFLIITSCFVQVHAGGLDEIFGQGSAFINDGKSQSGGAFNGQSLTNMIMSLYDKFWWAGLAIAAIVGTFLGIQFMMQGTEGKAKIKEALVPFVVGCMVIFGAFTIWRVAMLMFGQAESSAGTAGSPSQSNCGNGHHMFAPYGSSVQDINITTCRNCSYVCYHSNTTQLSSTQNESRVKCNECGSIFVVSHVNGANHTHRGIRTESNGSGIPYVICSCGERFTLCEYGGGHHSDGNGDGVCDRCYYPLAGY